jgi:hypothetical protein
VRGTFRRWTVLVCRFHVYSVFRLNFFDLTYNKRFAPRSSVAGTRMLNCCFVHILHVYPRVICESKTSRLNYRGRLRNYVVRICAILHHASLAGRVTRTRLLRGNVRTQAKMNSRTISGNTVCFPNNPYIQQSTCIHKYIVYVYVYMYVHTYIHMYRYGLLHFFDASVAPRVYSFSTTSNMCESWSLRAD